VNNRIKKPPVNISELKEGEPKEEAKKGPLNYVENKTSAGTPKSKLNLTQLILAVGLSIVLFFVISQFTLTSKGDAMTLLDNQKLLESKVSGVEKSIGDETGRIDNIINTQAGYATKSELSGLATQGALDSLRELITGYGNSITSLEFGLSSLEGRIEALESNNSTVVGEGAFDYWISDSRFYVEVSRDGLYGFKFTLVKDQGLSPDVLVYYTRSYNLSGERDWSLSNIIEAFEEGLEVGTYIEDYELYVEILVGTSSDLGPDEDYLE